METASNEAPSGLPQPVQVPENPPTVPHGLPHAGKVSPQRPVPDQMGPPQLFRPELPPAPPTPAAVVVGPLQGPGQLVAQVQHRQVLRAAVVRGAEGQVEEAGQVQHPPPHGAAVGGGGTSRAAQSRVEVPDGEAGEAQPQAPAGPFLAGWRADG